VTITHPFHPLRGRSFELIKVAANRHGGRVWVVGADGGRLPFPRAWTDLADIDPWQQAAAGRTPFRLDDLVQVADRLAGLRPPGPTSVEQGGRDV
jgi:hypothetical protein